MKKKQIRNKNGITLIALIITVVIMLILAGVAISALVGGEGLFSKIRETTKVYENATKKESEMLTNSIVKIEHYLNKTIPNPINQIVNVNQTYSGKTIGSYNDPIIPKGFAPINENNAIWGETEAYKYGLVITDEIIGGISTGNEFVWVPVDETIVKFERIDWNNEKGQNASDCLEEVPAEIRKSITTNGGFYIARFEAGKPQTGTLATDGSIKPISKQGATVWSSIAWSISGINDDTNPGNGAVTVARSMYPDTPDSEYGVVSTLVYGTQWDTTLKFIEAYNVGEEGYDTYAINSTKMGNYSGINEIDDIDSTSVPAECGAREGFMQKNIYDMAGNVWEMTMEKPLDSTTNCIYRSGAYDKLGSDYPASYRSHSGNVSYTNIANGFRVTLYIK